MLNLAKQLFVAIPRPWTAVTFPYVMRSIFAAGLALWLGFQLHLESPFSGASTVLLLVQPIQGAVLGKGFHRMLGTLVGLVAAFVLTGLFAQQMLLFIVGIGLWLGLCVGAMTVLRHYPATAAVVAGYTVCLALGPAIVAPEQGFDHIVTRGTAVALGCLAWAWPRRCSVPGRWKTTSAARWSISVSAVPGCSQRHSPASRPHKGRRSVTCWPWISARWTIN